MPITNKPKQCNHPATEAYIAIHWPEIIDVSGCAEFIVDNNHENYIDDLCKLWVEANNGVP